MHRTLIAAGVTAIVAATASGADLPVHSIIADAALHGSVAYVVVEKDVAAKTDVGDR